MSINDHIGKTAEIGQDMCGALEALRESDGLVRPDIRREVEYLFGQNAPSSYNRRFISDSERAVAQQLYEHLQKLDSAFTPYSRSQTEAAQVISGYLSSNFPVFARGR